VASNDNLPVTLLYFNASGSGENALLTWATSFEQNSDHFELELSLDGANFILIGRMPAQGNSNTNIYYAYTDSNICRYNTERLFYRLKQVDVDGTFKIYPVRSIKAGCNAEETIIIIPNPAKEYISVKGLSGSADIQIISAQGQLLMNRQNITSIDHINISQLPAGIFTIRIIKGNNILASVKFVKGQ